MLLVFKLHSCAKVGKEPSLTPGSDSSAQRYPEEPVLGLLESGICPPSLTPYEMASPV